MIPSDRFAADKATIRAELEKRARARRTITYSEAALMVGRVSQGLGRILDAIKLEERSRGWPDLGALVVRMKTGQPSYVGTPRGRVLKPLLCRRRFGGRGPNWPLEGMGTLRGIATS